MKVIILHLGLPKTATSTLQKNVLQTLHDEKKINFLGKNLKVDELSGKITRYNYSGKYIRDAIEEKISIDDALKKLNSDLDEEKINVFSDEGIMLAYPGENNLPLERKLRNIKVLFSDFDLKVVITLRDPVDYFYSLYVELFPDYYSQTKELNTFEKVVDKILEDPNNILFETFFYEKYMGFIRDNFHADVVVFEDILKNKSSYFSLWSGLLNINDIEFKQLFEKEHLNRKRKTNKGVRKLVSLKFIVMKCRAVLKKIKPVYIVLRVVYKNTFLRKFFKRRFPVFGVHEKPKKEVARKLYNLFGSYYFNFKGSKKDAD